MTANVLLDVLLKERLGEILKSRLEGRTLRVLEENRRVDDPRMPELHRLEIRLERVADEDGPRSDKIVEKIFLDVGEGERGVGESLGRDSGPSGRARIRR